MAAACLYLSYKLGSPRAEWSLRRFQPKGLVSSVEWPYISSIASNRGDIRSGRGFHGVHRDSILQDIERRVDR